MKIQKRKTSTTNFQPTKNESIVNEIRNEQAYEASLLYGREFHFLPVTERVKSKLLNEDIKRVFAESFKIMGFRSDDTMFNGSDGFSGGFGNIPLYEELLTIPTLWFKKIDRIPVEGDLILFPFSDLVFEITKVDTKTEEQSGDIQINDSDQFTTRLYLKSWNHSVVSEDVDNNDNDETLNDLLTDFIDAEEEIDEDQTKLTELDDLSVESFLKSSSE